MRALCALLLALAMVSACKKRVHYDRSSPSEALKSFFKAVSKKRLPRDLPQLISDGTERRLWDMRCRQRGCERGNLTIHEVTEESDWTARIVADYSVFGTGGERVFHGVNSPITLSREGDLWRITQFGERIPVPTAGADGTSDAGVFDASAAQDAGAVD